MILLATTSVLPVCLLRTKVGRPNHLVCIHIWEFPKIRDPNIDTRTAGLSLEDPTQIETNQFLEMAIYPYRGSFS